MTKLHKVLCIVCAVCIAITTIICSGITAFATLGTALWSTWDAADQAAKDLAALYHRSMAAMDNTKAFKRAYPNWYDMPLDWICTNVDVGTDLIDAGIEASYLLTPAGDLYYYIDDLGNLCVYERVGAGGESRYGAGGGGGRPKTVDTSNDTPIFSGDNYADIIRRLNEQYGIKNTKDYVSIRTDKRYDPSEKQSKGPISFFESGEFFGQSNWLECYLVPFYFDGSEYWYGLMERHFSQEVVTADDGNHVYMNVDAFSVVDDTVFYSSRVTNTAGTTDIDFATYRYADLYSYSDYSYRFYLYCYKTYSDYVSKKGTASYAANFNDYDTSNLYSLQRLYSESSLSDGTIDEYVTINDVYSNVYSSSDEYIEGMDFGYFVSDKPIEMGVNWTGIDPEKISSDTFITMEGDTIYDNSITNYEGDTTTVNEYITNNYNIYIQGGGSSGGGTTSGDINVGGNVNVSGDIGVGGQVDININVNQNQPSYGTGEAPSAYEYEEVNLEEALKQIPTVSDNFIAYIKYFFLWLPPEVLGLIIGGIGIAIVCRLAGR